MNPTRVFIVDDHAFFRAGVVQWLKHQVGLVYCGEAESVAAARRTLPEANPDVVLLDLHLRDGDGLDLAKELSESTPPVRVLVLSQAEEDVYAHRALRAGARGYVMKSEAAETVLAAIQTVMDGKVYVSRTVSAGLLHNLFPDPASPQPELARLSDRELQVFQLLGTGMKSGEVATRLRISPKTIDTYRENIKQKLGLANAEALIHSAKLWVQKGEFVTRKE